MMPDRRLTSSSGMPMSRRVRARQTRSPASRSKALMRCGSSLRFFFFSSATGGFYGTPLLGFADRLGRSGERLKGWKVERLKGKAELVEDSQLFAVRRHEGPAAFGSLLSAFQPSSLSAFSALPG